MKTQLGAFLSAVIIISFACADSLNTRLMGVWPYGVCYAVAVDSARHLAFVGSGGGVEIVDIFNSAQPQLVSREITTRGLVRELLYNDNRLFIAGSCGLEIWDVASPTHPEFLGRFNTPSPAYSVAVSGNFAYIGCNDGLWIVDVTNPRSPFVVGFTTCTTGSVRDVAVAGGLAYIGTTGGFDIIDVTAPQNPQSVGFWRLPFGGVKGVVLAGNFAYVTASADARLRVIDISSPQNPREVGSCLNGVGNNIGRLAIWGNYVYIACGTRGLQVVDVSEPKLPRVVGSLETSRPACGDIGIVDWLAYVPCENAGLRIIYVANPRTPQEIGCYNTPGSCHGIDVAGNYAYLGTWVGLYVLEVTDPNIPREVGFVSTPNYIVDVQVAGNYAYVAATHSGFRVIDISDPQHPCEVGSINTIGCVSGVAVAGNYAYVIGWDGFFVIDVSNPSNPTLVGFLFQPGKDLAVQGRYVYSVSGIWGWQGFAVIDVSQPTNPRLIIHLPFDYCNDVAVAGEYAYVAGSYLYVMDISNPSNPHQIGRGGCGFLTGIALTGDSVLGASGEGFFLLDVTDPQNPNIVGCYNDVTAEWKVAGNREYAYCSGSHTGLRVYQFYSTGIEEEKDYQPLSRGLTSNIFKSTIFLPTSLKGKGPCFLLDALGRRVLKLVPGENDVRGLSPGVYFISGNGNLQKVLLIK